MGADPAKPKLRWPLDVQCTEINGRRLALFNDPQGLAEGTVFIPLELMPIVSRLDGSKTVDEIAREGATFGVTVDIVDQVVRDLERMSLLDNAEVRARWERAKLDFRRQTLREPMLVGTAYPQSPDDLRCALEEFRSGANGNPLYLSREESVCAVMAPHIDYRRGRQTYGAILKALDEVAKPDVIFLLGTAHQPGRGMFHLTDKDFAVPLGTLPAQREMIREIVRSVGEECFADEILHKREHSLELQLPLIAYRFGREGLPTIVPLLVGSFHRFVSEARSPLESAEVSRFIEALAGVYRSARAAGSRVLFWSGVDLAHVGTHFGDASRMTSEGLECLRQRDKELLDCLLAGDDESLFEHIAGDGDLRRICGFPALYVMLACLRLNGCKLRGHLLEYRQAVDEATDCVVSFAGACWMELRQS